MTEHWNPFARIRQDLFGVFDLVALRVNGNITRYGCIYGVQVTSTANLSARRHKVMGSKEAMLWCTCGGVILLHGWSKKGPRGKRKTWTLTEERLTSSNWDPEPLF